MSGESVSDLDDEFAEEKRLDRLVIKGVNCMRTRVIVQTILEDECFYVDVAFRDPPETPDTDPHGYLAANVYPSPERKKSELLYSMWTRSDGAEGGAKNCPALAQRLREIYTKLLEPTRE